MTNPRTPETPSFEEVLKLPMAVFDKSGETAGVGILGNLDREQILSAHTSAIEEARIEEVEHLRFRLSPHLKTGDKHWDSLTDCLAIVEARLAELRGEGK